MHSKSPGPGERVKHPVLGPPPELLIQYIQAAATLGIGDEFLVTTNFSVA